MGSLHQDDWDLDPTWLSLDLCNYESTGDAQSVPPGATQPSRDPLPPTIFNHIGDHSILGHSHSQAQIPYVLPIQPESSTNYLLDQDASSGLATTFSQPLQMYGRNSPPHFEGPTLFPQLQEPSPHQASPQVAMAPPTPTFEVFAMDKGRARKGTPIRYDSIIKARPDTKITLRVELSSVSHDSIPWDGLVIPRTYSVKQSEGRTLQQPVKFRLLVYGASSPAKEPWKDVCDKCRTNEYQRRYKSPPTPEQFARFQVPLVDFDAPDPSIILHEGSADVDFRFRCYPNHQSHRAGRFKLVAELYGDNVTPMLYEIRSTFELLSRATWKVVPLLIAEGMLHSDTAGAQGGGLSVGTAAPVESPRDIPSAHSGSHHIPHSAMPATEAHEATQPANRQSPEYVTPPASPRNPSPENVPPTPAREQERERASPAPARTAPTDPIPTTNNTPVTVLHSVNPGEGPTSGGKLISLYVTNLDPGTRVFPRFGCNIGNVVYRRDDFPGGLLCDLPKAAQPGVVKVTLSLSDSADAPEFGESTAKFTYVVGMSEAVGLLLQIFTGQLLPAAFAWLQKFMQQPTTSAPDAVAPQRDGNGVEGSSTRVLPELAFIETLSTIRSLPDFSQRLATVNEYGQTLLHLAVHLRYPKLVQQLVEWGVGLDVQDINGFTALHCAYLCDDGPVVTILKQSGASVFIFDALGRLPSDLSANSKPVAINLDVETADAADSDTTPHSRTSSDNSLGGSIQEHQGAAMERTECSTAGEAFSPPMSHHSSDHKPATNASGGYPNDSPSASALRGCHQFGSSLAPHNLVAPLKRSKDRLTSPPVQAQPSSEIQVDIAEKATATLAIPVLDTLWDQTLKLEKLKVDLNTGHEYIKEEPRDVEMSSLPLDDRHPPTTSSSASSVYSEQAERSMASTVAAAVPAAPGPTMVTSSATDGAKNFSPSASLTLAPPRTTSTRTGPRTTKPHLPRVSTARNSPAAHTAIVDAPRALPSGTGSTTSAEGAALTGKLNSTWSGVGGGNGNGNGNEQLPLPPSPTPTVAFGAAVTAANVSAPGGGVSNVHDFKSPASGTILVVGGAVPPSLTGGSRTAPSPSHHSQHPHPHPRSSAAEPPPSSSVTNRVPESIRRPYTATARYPNLDTALQRIGDLEDEVYTLRYELDRARAAPPSSSSAVVSAAAVDSVFSAFSLFERESTHLEVRSRDARENFARALLGLVGHARGRDRYVLSSGMIPAGERDWRNSPTDYRHPHHDSQRAQSSPVVPPQSASPHHAERGHPPPPSSSRHIDQRGYAYPASRPSPRPAHDRSLLQQPPLIALPPSNSTSLHHGHHPRTGTPGGFDLTRARKEHIDSYSHERASSLAQAGEKRPRAPSFGAEASSGGGRDHREEKRLRVSRDGAWVKRESDSPKDEERTNGNSDDFPSPRRRTAGLPNKGGVSTAAWMREHQPGARPLPADGVVDEAEGDDAMCSPDTEIAKRNNDEGLDVDEEMLGLVGERSGRTRRESTATGTGRGEEMDGEVDELLLATIGATGPDRPHRRDPYDHARWHDGYAPMRYARDREGSAKPLGHHPSSGSSDSPINSYSSPAHHHHHPHGSDRDRGYIFHNMHPGGMESVSQQRGSVSFPHPSAAGGESTHSSSRGVMYSPGKELPNSAGSNRATHFLPRPGPPQPKKIYHHSKSITLPPGNGSIPGGATAPPGPGGNAIRGPGPGPPHGQPVRTCKSCGEPGRYKDGRCVEKWGPGPHGPGTVCDRCRKKMKRVEKRSGMEAAAAAAQNSLASGGRGVHYVQDHPYPRVGHPPARSGSFAVSQHDEYSQSTVALDDPQSQAYEGQSQGYYGQDHYRSERMLPPPHRRESSQSGSSQELHREDRGRRLGLPFHHEAPLTGGGASGAGGEYNTVLPPRRRTADGDSYREEREQERERESRPETGRRDTSMRNSREAEDDDADGDAEMGQLEDDLADSGRNKVKKEDS